MLFEFLIPSALSYLSKQWTAGIFGGGNATVANPAALAVCEQLRDVGKVDVFFPGSSTFSDHIKHASPSASQVSTCSVGPKDVQEVGEVIRAIAEHRSPFAVKGGGHTGNQEFSSTVGVQISMGAFREVTYSKSTSSVRVGAGLAWDDVYAILEPHGVNVAGSRITGVGVAGFALGGGYSWQANDVGLTIDTILEFELIKPNGEAINVTEKSDPDLFFAVRGSWNNFGIVTTFTFKTFPQPEILAGSMAYSTEHFVAYSTAVSKYARTTKDPKSQIGAVISTGDNMTMLLAFPYYHGPQAPKGIYDDFFAIPAIMNDVKTRSFSDFISTTAGVPGLGLRVTYDTVALLDYSPSLIEVIRNQSEFWVARGLKRVNIIMEPLLDSVASHSPSPAAYPHPPNHPLRPLCIWFCWEKEEDDEKWSSAIKSATQAIYEQALREGQDIDAKDGKQIRYGNYAAAETSAEMIWGPNLDRLRKIQKTVDPDRVMTLAGGWKV